MNDQTKAALAVDALQAAAQLGAVLERDIMLARKGPVAAIAAWAWANARGALADLIEADPDQPGGIRQLQGEVTKFLDLHAFITDVLAKANDAAAQLDIAHDEEALREVTLLFRPQQNGPIDL